MLVRIILATITLYHLCNSQECPSNPNKPLYTRTFLGLYNGTVGYGLDKAAMRKAVGDCGGGLEALAEDMFKFFESGYGLDLSAAKDNPFEPYSDPQYSITPVYTDEKGGVDIMEFETFYEYANYLHKPLYFSAWVLSFNSTFTGTRGTVKAGQRVARGMFRIDLDGGDFCIRVHFRNPEDTVPDQKVSPQDYVLYNDVWGIGALRGVSEDVGGFLRQQYVITFPA